MLLFNFLNVKIRAEGLKERWSAPLGKEMVDISQLPSPLFCTLHKADNKNTDDTLFQG